MDATPPKIAGPCGALEQPRYRCAYCGREIGAALEHLIQHHGSCGARLVWIAAWAEQRARFARRAARGTLAGVG